jgi:hypothetical protein
MTTPAALAGIYSDATKLPQPTGSDVQRTMAAIRVRLTARYVLAAVPGRAEELEQTATGRRVSLGYGCKSIRIRRQEGRTWLDHIDIPIREGWHAEVYAYLDDHFGYIPSKDIKAPRFKDAFPQG